MTEIPNLTQKKCRPCEGIGAALSKAQAEEYLLKTPGWQMRSDAKLIYREYAMKNFMAAISAITDIAKIAEDENHHPDLHLTGYRKLRIELSTHALGGLSENDFIVAAKIDALPLKLKS